jgi:hypothetical protein
VITELESHTSQQALTPQHESKLGEEPPAHPRGEHGQSKLQEGAKKVRGERELTRRPEVPAWHGEAVPARPRWHQARGRWQRHIGKAPHPPAPDLAKGKAKQLETQLEVAMAEIQGAGGDGAEGVEEIIDQISWTGRSTIARSIDWHPSRRLTSADVIGIKCGGGGVTQSPEHGREEGERRARGSGRSV